MQRIYCIGLSLLWKGRDSAKLQAAYKAVTSDQPLTLLPSLLRRERNASKFVDSTERANREKNEREKYAILLCEFIKEADLPVISEIRDLADPEAATKRLFGSRRSKTLRNRYRSWKRYSEWLKVTKLLRPGYGHLVYQT